jgi:hypothetical protein
VSEPSESRLPHKVLDLLKEAADELDRLKARERQAFEAGFVVWRGPEGWVFSRDGFPSKRERDDLTPEAYAACLAQSERKEG